MSPRGIRPPSRPLRTLCALTLCGAAITLLVGATRHDRLGPKAAGRNRVVVTGEGATLAATS